MRYCFLIFLLFCTISAECQSWYKHITSSADVTVGYDTTESAFYRKQKINENTIKLDYIDEFGGFFKTVIRGFRKQNTFQIELDSVFETLVYRDTFGQVIWRKSLEFIPHTAYLHTLRSLNDSIAIVIRNPYNPTSLPAEFTVISGAGNVLFHQSLFESPFWSQYNFNSTIEDDVLFIRGVTSIPQWAPPLMYPISKYTYDLIGADGQKICTTNSTIGGTMPQQGIFDFAKNCNRIGWNASPQSNDKRYFTPCGNIQMELDGHDEIVGLSHNKFMLIRRNGFDMHLFHFDCDSIIPFDTLPNEVYEFDAFCEGDSVFYKGKYFHNTFSDTLMKGANMDTFLIKQFLKIDTPRITSSEVISDKGNSSGEILIKTDCLDCNYIWSNGSKNKNIDSLEAGEYSVHISNISSFYCSSTYNFLIEKDSTLLVSSEINSQLPLRISPNPMNTISIVQFRPQFPTLPVESGDLFLEVYSVDGRLVRTVASCSVGSCELERGGLPSGLYIVKMRDRDGRILGVGKVVME